MLYRGTEKGFSAERYHELVDGVEGGTIHFILSDKGEIFGGLTNLPIKSTESGDPDANRYPYDPTALIFSLTKRSVHKQNETTTDMSVLMDKHCLSCFGNLDIQIKDNCNQNEVSSCANFGSRFKLPKGMKYFSTESISYLAGSDLFRVLEIEVY